MDTLRVGIAPWTYMKPECFPSRKTGCNAGVELDILDTIATLANLTIVLKISNSTGCGKAETNGTWTGLLKMMENNEIDVTGNLCYVNRITELNQTFFTPSWPVWQYQPQFLIRVPPAPPLSFAPFSPFNWTVWLAYAVICILCVGAVVLGYFMSNACIDKLQFFEQIYQTTIALTDAASNVQRKMSAQIILPLWLLFLTSFFMFYNTYILSAGLHPFPIKKPFSDANGYVSALLSNRYRVLSFSPFPNAYSICPDEKCLQQFDLAARTRGHAFFRGDPLSVMAKQNREDPELVLIDGMPFISLYFSNYPPGGDNFWTIDAGYQEWTAYFWKKNLTHANKLNRFIREIGDYKFRILSKSARPRGSPPHTEDRIFVNVHEQQIMLAQFKGLFWMHLGGMIASILAFFAEILFSIQHKRSVIITEVA